MPPKRLDPELAAEAGVKLRAGAVVPPKEKPVLLAEELAPAALLKPKDGVDWPLAMPAM